MPIKNKEERVGSVKKSNLLSFDEDDIWVWLKYELHEINKSDVQFS